MIYETTVKKYCKDFTKIENYEKAIEDKTQKWDCHHRLETHNSDGERRLVDISHKELKALGMYYDRPAEELIFMVRVEHISLHNKGKQFSEEHRGKLAKAKEGKSRTEEVKRKISETMKGKEPWNKGRHISEETKRKISEARKGKHLELVEGRRVWH